MNKMKILLSILCICLITPIFQHINVTATRDRTLEQMITDSFVIIDEDGNSRIVQAEAVSSKEKEVSVADKYEIVDNIGGNDEVVDTFASEEEAVEAVSLLNDEDLTVQPFNLRAVQYGVVYIQTNGTTEYKMVETGQTGYTHGGYGRDAAYIGTFNGKIRAKFAGVIADFDADDVDVVTFSDDTVTSYYIEEEGYLKHYYLYGSSKVYAQTRVGYDLDYLESNKKYYSYDGHYFYDTYQQMIKDYQSGKSTGAVNANNPYYNYYQFLSHRSTTTLTGDDLNNITKEYFDNEASYQTSQFKDIGNIFITNQNKYYVNAMLMFGVAANESNWGRSTIAYDKNNLFGHGANDSNPYWGSHGYSSVAESIEYHAYYFVSRGYLDYNDWRHFGPHVGDKESGLNVKYASDPYWGEKAASRSYYLNEQPADYNVETIGIIEGAFDKCNLYKEASTSSTVVTTLTNLSNFPVLIIDEILSEGKVWYKIASDTSLNEARTKPDYSLIYRPDHDYLYIPADYVRVVNQGDLANKTDGNITIPVMENGHRIKIKDNNLVTESKTTVKDVKAIDANAVIKNGDTEITDNNAAIGTGYTVTINGKTYTLIKLGDVNGDGNLTPSDYVKIKNHIMKVSTLLDNYLVGADMNSDGKISPADYVKVKNAIMAR